VDIADGRFRRLLEPIFVVERLQREPASGLSSTASLGNVWIVAAHRLRLVNLQLRVQAFQLRLRQVTLDQSALLYSR